MNQLDLAFGRLTAAWMPALHRTDLLSPPPTTAAGAAARLSVDCLPPLAAPAVLVVERAEPLPGRGEAAAQLARRMAGCGAYQFVTVALCSCEELEQALHQHRPRMLVVDIALLEHADAATVRYLQRRVPGVDWLLAWPMPSSHGFELAVRSRARGCIEWHNSAEQIEQALQTVAAGDLWFPRRVMQSLYFSLLAAAQTELPALGFEEPAAPPPGCSDVPLTEREVEVLTLMRRGLTNKQIGKRLGVSVNTVKKHLAHVFDKRGLHSRRQMLA